MSLVIPVLLGRWIEASGYLFSAAPALLPPANFPTDAPAWLTTAASCLPLSHAGCSGH